MNIQEQVHVLRDLFVNRDDIYACQYKNGKEGGFKLIKRHLSDKILEEHLLGEITLGVFPGAYSRSKWICIDIDSTVFDEVNNIWQEVERYSIPAYFEYSGNKGYHCWVFFSEPIENKKLRVLGQNLGSEWEVFPKQDFTNKDKPGNLIKLPLGVNLNTGKRCLFIDREFCFIDDQFELLKNIKKASIGNLIIKKDLSVKPQIYKKQENKPRTPNIIKPCVMDAIKNGTKNGKRHFVGHIIACEFKRLGKNEGETRNVINKWNKLSDLALPVNDIKYILRSAFSGDYQYGCNSNGTIRQYLECEGKDRCCYYEEFVNNIRLG